MSDDISHKISNMSFLCALLVVLLHIFPSNQASTTVQIVDKFISYGLGRIAVPFFFIASGYFIGHHVGDKGWWKFAILKRLKTLLIPYLMWNILFAILLLSAIVVADLNAGRSLSYGINEFNFCSVIGLDPFCQPVNGVTWYIRALLMYLALSPFLVWCLRKSTYVTLVGLAGAYLILFDPIRLTESARFFSRFFSLEGLFYYTLGVAIGIGLLPKFKTKNISYYVHALILVLGVGVTFWRIYCQRVNEIEMYNCLRVAVVPLLLFPMWELMTSRSMPNWLCRSTFAIFVIHPFITFIIKICFRGAIDCMVGYIGCFVMSVVVSIGGYNVLKALLPRVAVYAFGGR